MCDMEAGLAQDLVNRIRSVIEPRAILLFGSSARGMERPDSDVDVCVIVPDSLRPRVIARAIYRSLYGFARPVDVVVVTTSRWERHREEVGLIYRAIDRDNVLLYAA